MREELSLLLPAGWDFNRLFGVQLSGLSRDVPTRDHEHRQRLELPNTSTGYRLTLALGIALLISGTGLSLWRRTERHLQCKRNQPPQLAAL